METSWLIRWYVRYVTPHTRWKRAQWDAAWVRGTIRFGWQLVAIGLALLVLCIAVLPDDNRKWLFVVIGLAQVLIGIWHVRAAEAICRYAQLTQGPSQSDGSST